MLLCDAYVAGFVAKKPICSSQRKTSNIWKNKVTLLSHLFGLTWKVMRYFEIVKDAASSTIQKNADVTFTFIDLQDAVFTP
jgi:hypothetical protein